MKTSLGLLLLGFASLAACASTARAPAPVAAQATSATATAPAAAVVKDPAPPLARREPHTETLHGVALSDEYRWLRHKDTPEVVSYLQAENAYAEVLLKPTEALQQRLYDEMLARIKQTDSSVPVRRRGYFYYSRTVEGQQYWLYCRKNARGAAADDRTGKTATAPEEVLLDLNALGHEHKFVSLGTAVISDDSTLMAYTLDVTGFRQYTLRIKDLAGSRSFAEEIPRVDGVAWAADGKTLFYVTEDAVSKRADHLYRHVVGTPVQSDVLIYDEKDELFTIGLDETRSRKYLVLTSESKTTTESRLLRTDRPNDAWRVLEPRHHDVRYYVEHRGGDFYVRTDAPATENGPKARNFRVVTAPVATPDRAHWKELVAHDDNVMLEDLDVFADRVVLRESADALPRIVVIPLVGKDKGKREVIPLSEAVYALFSDSNPEFESSAYRFHYQSPVTPDSTYEWDAHTHQLTLLKRQPVLGGFDGSRYTTARLHAVAADGAQVPISIVYRKDLQPTAPHPLLLYGYGSYGYSTSMTFSSNDISLLDRGVVYAVGHIRGGGDLGTRWHEEGRMATKMNTFTDFIACAEALIKAGWTAPDRLVIQGASAGGLLMGAVTNLRPDLWKAVVAQVPFVDVINTMLDETLPLTVGEFEEWGNPKNKGDFDVMIKYSPYDNVAKKDYPAMLVMSSYNDSQVMYWEPAKWVARLRANKTDHNPLLLRVNMEPAGHGGQSGRYSHLHETALWMGFVLHELALD